MPPLHMTLSLEKCPGLACGTGGDKRAKGNETSRDSGRDRTAAREARRPREGWWPASWHQEGGQWTAEVAGVGAVAHRRPDVRPFLCGPQ